MWAVLRFMMYWNVPTSGVRAMLALRRLPESWIGPYFWVARAGRGVRQESTASIVAASAWRRIDIPPSVAWPMCCVLRALASPQSRGLQSLRGGRREGVPPPATSLRRLQDLLRSGQDEGTWPGETGGSIDRIGAGCAFTEGRDHDPLRARLGIGGVRPEGCGRVGVARPHDRTGTRRGAGRGRRVARR